MKPHTWITAIVDGNRPAVIRVKTIGENGDWRLVQPWPYRREDAFEFAIHRRYIYDKWINAWRQAKSSSWRLRKRISGRVPGTGECFLPDVSGDD